MKPKIVAILWTWSWCGYSVRWENGKTDSICAGRLVELVGQAEYERIAHQFPCNCYKPV